MLNRKYFDRVGEFDEGFYPAYFEDNDSHRRMNLANVQCTLYPPAMFYHYGSRTQNENGFHPVELSQKFERNRAYYISKWGGGPGEEIFKNPMNDSSKSIKWISHFVINR